MNLKMYKRNTEKKGEANELRRNGKIPAIIYMKGKSGEPIAIDSNELTSVLRHVLPGRLSTTKFNLVDEKGKQRSIVIKDIQYNVTNYEIVHLDFEELHDKVPVSVKVPIECTGMAECPGIKLGGALRQVIRYLRVRCLPKDIPDMFELDVRAMGPRESKRLSDLQIPNAVRPLANLREVVAVIVKR